MKRVSWIALLLVIGSGIVQAQDWKLVWAEEFNQTGLPNPQIWDYEEGYIRNQELQYYTRARMENAQVENGTLIIESRKEDMGDKHFTSASLITLNKQHFRYGRLEVCAKLPTGKGMWPAIWLLGVNRKQVGWPTCGEIDVMENVGFDPDRIHANIHTKAYNHVKKTGKGSSIVVEKPYEKFHIYALEWTPERLDFFVDDQKYFVYENDGSGEASWPFDQEFYLILNAAVGGAWGGQKGVDETIFPQKYYIDYVRYYQKTELK